jgi:hypothetical protein
MRKRMFQGPANGANNHKRRPVTPAGIITTLLLVPVLGAPTCQGNPADVWVCGLNPVTFEVVLGDDASDCSGSEVWPAEATDDDGDGYCEGWAFTTEDGSIWTGCAPGAVLSDCNDADPTVWAAGDCVVLPPDTGLETGDTGPLPVDPLGTDDDGDGLCEGVDNAGDGTADECNDGSVAGDCDDTDAGTGLAGTWYADGDGDGYGDDASAIVTCDGTGLVAVGGDCDDTNANAFPGNPEVCDLVDNDCLNGVDDGGVCPTDPLDTDDDGDGKSENEGDCDDADAGISPDQKEDSATLDASGTPTGLNDVDDDCDGEVDEVVCADGSMFWYMVTCTDLTWTGGFDYTYGTPGCQYSNTQGQVTVSLWDVVDDDVSVAECDAAYAGFGAAFTAGTCQIDLQSDSDGDGEPDTSEGALTNFVENIPPAVTTVGDLDGDGLDDDSDGDGAANSTCAWSITAP